MVITMTEENMTREEYRLTHVGSFSTEIVGIQYYKGEVAAGDEVVFERAPYNPYDDNAIEAHNKNDELAGHLPRTIAVFTAPLVDRGEVFLKGRVTGEGDKWRKPLKLEVFTTVKGALLFSRKVESEFAPVVHNQVADIYEHSGEYSASVIERLTELYRSEKLELLPETCLLVHILRGKAEDKREEERRSAEMILKGFLKNFSAGEPLSFRDMTIVPVFKKSGADDNCERVIPSCRADLKYSISGGTDKEESMLHIKNLTANPVLVTGGECPPLSEKGIMVRRSAVISPGSEADLRFYRLGWGDVKVDMNIIMEPMMAAPDLRIIPTFSPDRNRGDAESEQHLVLEEIDCLAAAADIDVDGYRGLWERSAALLSGEDLPGPVHGAAGYAFFFRGEMMACDIFSSPEMADGLFHPLLRGAFVQCCDKTDEAETEHLAESINYAGIIDELLNDKTGGEIRFADNGASASLKLEDSSLTVLLYNGLPVHAFLWKYRELEIMYECCID